MSVIKLACLEDDCEGFVTYTPGEIPIFLAFKHELGASISEVVSMQKFAPALKNIMGKRTELGAVSKVIYLTCIPKNHTNGYEIITSYGNSK